jgi:hypothetical protein
MKIKCLRFECESCSKLASIQVFYNKGGIVKYARARHYTGQQNGKPPFEYHQQSLEYIQRKLGEMPMDKTEIGHIGQNGQSVNVDLKKPELMSKLSTMAGGEGFEPSTPNLGGWCSIRTELRGSARLGLSYSPTFPSSNSLRRSAVITLTFELPINLE